VKWIEFYLKTNNNLGLYLTLGICNRENINGTSNKLGGCKPETTTFLVTHIEYIT